MKHPALTLLLFTLLACGGKDGDAGQEGGGGREPEAVAVRVVEVEERELVFYDNYPGTVSPLERVEVRPQIGGYITAKHFEDGDPVRAGQKLYTIDVRRYVADVNQAEAGIASAKANVALAEKNVARYRRLAEAEAIATQTLDQAEAELESRQQDLNRAEAARAAARTQLDYAVIRAPLGGLTDLNSVKVGTQVSAGNPVLTTISRQEPVGVDFAVPQEDIPRLSRFERMPAAQLDSTFRLRLPNDSTYINYGRVYASDQSVDPRTGALTVRLAFDNPDNVLRNGMNVSVEMINRQAGRQLVVPERALTEQMGEFYVYQIEDSLALRRNVRTGARVRDQRIILEGLEAGVTVAVEGLKAVRDSSKVRIQAPKS